MWSCHSSACLTFPLKWHSRCLLPNLAHGLVGLVAKASASGAEDPGFESRLKQDFSRSSHTSDSKIGTPVATLPGAWHYWVSTETGKPSVSILWLGEEVWSAISVSLWQHVKLSEQIRPWDTLACCRDIMQPTKKQTQIWSLTVYLQCLQNQHSRERVLSSRCILGLNKVSQHYCVTLNELKFASVIF